MSVNLDHGDDELDETHEINVTPFIDVMLVLLIIFMVAAPLATVDVPVDLPGMTAESTPQPDAPVFLTIQADLSIALGDVTISRQDLAAALDRAMEGRDEPIFLRADETVAYGDLMKLMNHVREAGYSKVALVGLDR